MDTDTPIYESGQPGLYVVGLIADQQSHSAKRLKPTFKDASILLRLEMGNRGVVLGEFAGNPATVLVNISDVGVLEELARQPFIDQLPVAGNTPAIWPAEGTIIYKIDFDDLKP